VGSSSKPLAIDSRLREQKLKAVKRCMQQSVELLSVHCTADRSRVMKRRKCWSGDRRLCAWNALLKNCKIFSRLSAVKLVWQC